MAPTLRTIQDAMRHFPYRYEVLIVDDGSSDRTFDVAEEFLRGHPEMSICVHRNARNLGLSRSFVDAAFRGQGNLLPPRLWRQRGAERNRWRRF